MFKLAIINYLFNSTKSN